MGPPPLMPGRAAGGAAGSPAGLGSGGLQGESIVPLAPDDLESFPPSPEAGGGVDLPAPRGAIPQVLGGGEAGGADLPALREKSGPKSPQAPLGGVDLPAPKAPASKGLGKGPSGVDLPAPRGAPPKGLAKGPSGVDLPAPKGVPPRSLAKGPSGVDLPAPRGAPPRPTAKGPSGVDLPAPKGPPPKGLAKGPSGVDLPAPKGVPPRSPAKGPSGVDLPAPKGPPPRGLAKGPSGVDLPAPKGVPPRSPAKGPSGVDLPAPKGISPQVPGTASTGLDLPGPRAPVAPGRVPPPAGPKKGSSGVDLPAPAGVAVRSFSKPTAGADLPRPKPPPGPPPPREDEASFGGLELDLPTSDPQPGRDEPGAPDLGFGDALGGMDLPDLDLPTPQSGRGAPAAPAVDLPMALDGMDLPGPLAGSGSSSSLDSLDLPVPIQSQDLVAPKDEASFGDLDLPMPPELTDDLPVARDELELPQPLRPPGGPDLTEEGTSRGDVGGVAFGELDLGGNDDADGMEFADLPEERESLGGAVGPTIAMSAPAVAPADARATAAMADEAVDLPVKGRRVSSRLLMLAGGLTLVIGAGVALGFTSHGYFGVYFLERFLPAAGDDTRAAQVIAQAEKQAQSDRYADVRASLRALSNGRNEMGLNRRLLARSLLHESLYRVRFGEDAASGARATRIDSRLAQRGHDAPGMSLALAAAALSQGAFAEAKGWLAQVPAGEKDPYSDLLRGELALAEGDGSAAAKAFDRAVRNGAGARGHWGLARARLGGKDPAEAKSAIEATLKASPTHAGALTAQARMQWGQGDWSEGLRLARAAAGARGQAGSKVSGSASERARAWTLVGQIEEQRGHRTQARTAYEAALEADAYVTEALVGSGRVLLLDERHRDALTRFEAVLEANPGAGAETAESAPASEKSLLAEAKLGAARAMISLGRVRDAKTVLEALLQELPEDADVALWLGKAEESLEDVAAAEQRYRDAIQFRPKSFDGYLALSKLFFAIDRSPDATAVLKQARERVEETAYLRRMLGQLELERGDAEAAAQEFERALALDASDIPARFGLGQALRRAGRLPEAGEAFGRVAELDSAWPGLALERGLVYEAQGNSRGAVESYRRALSERPDDPDLLLRLGAAYVAGGKIDEAEETLKKVIEERPNSAEAEHFIGRVQFARGNFPRALTHFSRAVSLDGSRAEFQLYVGWVSLEMGNLARALEAVALALERDASLADAYWIRGRVRLRTGAVRDALNDLERALELKPGRFEAYAAMGDCYDQLRRIPDAIEAYRKALHHDNSVGRWWYRLGRLQMDNGKRREAVEALGRATVLGDAEQPRPGWSSEAHRILADGLRLGGKRQEAIRHYRIYLEQAPSTAIDRNSVRDQLMEMGVAP